jgi:hypothetical protein
VLQKGTGGEPRQLSSRLLDSPARGFQEGSRGEALSKVVDGGGRGDAGGLDDDGWIDGNERSELPYIHYATCPVVSWLESC